MADRDAKKEEKVPVPALADLAVEPKDEEPQVEETVEAPDEVKEAAEPTVTVKLVGPTGEDGNSTEYDGPEPVYVSVAETVADRTELTKDGVELPESVAEQVA